MMPVANFEENYADWTEERRREVRGAFERRDRLEKIEEAARQVHGNRRVELARAKLTEEEFDAVYD